MVKLATAADWRQKLLNPIFDCAYAQRKPKQTIKSSLWIGVELKESREEALISSFDAFHLSRIKRKPSTRAGEIKQVKIFTLSNCSNFRAVFEMFSILTDQLGRQGSRKFPYAIEQTFEQFRSFTMSSSTLNFICNLLLILLTVVSWYYVLKAGYLLSPG